ncbi:hypothetical protein PMG11_11063 [Penicillium brasilianum]|uniref:Uncharacterized protein n=1 Tax=Penicillium brasilianum TaxID=104259 RepID=A0A0F7U2T3_PENBI|nr:hypothetical protein PMG11_11063 [Penicillium brasilianum]
MDTSSINPAEELPEIQPTSGYPPADEPIIHMEQHPQIDVDLPSGPAIQAEDTERPYLKDQPFAPAMDALERLEREDPKLAFQAARLVGLYRRLWESCMAKHMQGKKLTTANDGLRETQQKLVNEKNKMQSSHDDQLARSHFFDQALESSRLRLTEILKEWDHYSDGLESKLSE